MDCLYCTLSVKTPYSFSAALLKFCSSRFILCVYEPPVSALYILPPFLNLRFPFLKCTSHVIKVSASLPALSRSDDDDAESRSSRVTQLCTYFQQKYKHLCRLERADSRQKKCRHTFRKALLQAASREPECTGQLIQELQRAACSRARSELRTAPVSKNSPCLFSLVFERMVKTQRVVDILSWST